MDKFILPDDIPDIPPGRSQPLSKNTTKLYRALLKVFAKEGYYTRELLIEHSKEVLAIITANAKGKTPAETRQKQRQYLSAIMYVMTHEYKQTPNPFYTYFQTAKDPEELETNSTDK